MNNPSTAAADEEETERKLLEDSDDSEMGDDGKIDDEVEQDLGLDDDEDVEEEQLAGKSAGASEQQQQRREVSSDSDEDSDDSDDSDEGQDEQAEAEVAMLEASLIEQPYNYDVHKMLIEKLHSMGELERLRAARENMSSTFPLTSDIWLSWIRDEIKLALTQEQKMAVIELCERAVQDYLSVEVWLEYLQFSMGLGTEKETTEKIRNLFERALTAAGLHVMKGGLIWDAFREFENFLILMIDSEDPNKKDEVNRIGKLYRRQLACPLYGMDKTFEEYGIWRSMEGANCTEDDNIIKSGYERASSQLNSRLPFELKLESARSKEEQLDSYKVYLTYEKQNGDPGRVSVLYERAVADLSLETTLWVDYISYLETNIKIDDIIEKVYMRAVRNIPWCSKIWQKWIRFYEKTNKPLLEVQKLIESALQMECFSAPEEYKNLWMSYLEYLRRKIDDKTEDEKKMLEILRKAFDKAGDYLARFGIEGDPSCEILQFWARVEAIYASDMEKARNLWADIMSQGHSESAASWLEYVSLERCYGDTKHLRKLFQKALASVKDWPESIANAWINFERDEGTLEQMEICEARTKERLEKVAEERQKSQQPPTRREEGSANKQRAGKRKLDDGGRWKNLGSSTKMAKLDKPFKERERPTQDAEKSEHSEKISNNMAKSKVAPPPGFEEHSQEQTEEGESFQKVDDKLAVFISNLDFTATEDEVREVLKPAGTVTLFRLVKNFKGVSKGFGYVQLSSPEEVEEALKLDRVCINGRPMFISRCNPNRAPGASFKYRTELEKNKLFIRGLPLTTTKEHLVEIFKEYGALKDVRIVTFRNGRSKGLAYVEFEDENCASKAVVATDGMTIEDKEISVAISQPPQRRWVPPGSSDEPYTSRSLGGSSSSRATFGKPRTILSLVPRTVGRNANASSNSQTDAVVTGNGAGNGVVQPLSNADFRNFLLKK